MQGRGSRRNSGRRVRLLAGVALLLLAISSTAAAAEPMAVASAVRVEQTADATRFLVDLSSPAAPHAYVLADPNRVVIDLPEVDFRIDPDAGKQSGPAARGKVKAPSQSLVGSFRFGLFAAGKSRIVIDLTEPARIAKAESQASAAGSQLVVELARTDKASFAAAAARSAVADRPPPQALMPLPSSDDKPVIVLDAGHGGVDTGALGGAGVVEKDITLAFATSLAGQLEAGGRYRVVLTRSGDLFVPLGERVRIARAAGASLFMSIHADTVSDATAVAGATVYTVSERASDSEAARVAEKENQADAAGGLDRHEDVADVSDILFDLTRRETRAFGHIFARSLISVWKGAGRLNKNPERSAGFVVLKAPDVPSVLLELGYLSNPQDATALTSGDWRGKAATTVAQAIDSFFASRSPTAGRAVAGLRREALQP